MPERVAALIPAAGGGERLGRGPKALVPLAGRPLLCYALAAFQGSVDEVVVALPAGAEEETLARCAPYVDLTGVRSIAGGATRQETVARLLAASQAALVLVHDAARPFLDRGTIERSIAAAREHGAASVGMPVVDTLVTHEGGAVDRSTLRAVQTPQSFRRELLERAHQHALLRGDQATDDAGLVRALGVPVVWVEGSPELFKITTAGDLAIAEALVASGLYGLVR